MTKIQDFGATRRPEPATERDTHFDLRGALSLIWFRKWTLVTTILLCVAIGVVFVKKSTPIYTSAAEVMLNTRKTNVVDVESVVSGIPVDSKFVDGEIAVITSAQLIDRVVEKLRLDRDPEFNSRLRPDTFIDEWVATAKASLPEEVRLALGLERPDVLSDPAEEAERERLSVIRSVKGAVNVRQRGVSVVILIQVTSEDPRKAALIANTVADQYLVDQLEAKFEATQRATSWLNDRVEELRGKVEGAEAAVEAFRERLSIGEEQGVEITTQQIAALNSQLISARGSLAEAEARYDQVDKRIRESGFGAAADVLSSPLILTLRQQRAELQRRSAELSNRYGERHPTMINLRAEIADVSSAIGLEVRKIVEGLRNDVAVANARVNTLVESLEGLEDRSVTLARSSVELRQLEREAQADRLIYENFLNRFRETSQQDELIEADARIIAKAQPPAVPSSPKTSLVVALAGLLGLTSGLGLIFFSEMNNRTFRLPEEVEAETGTNVLAYLPDLGSRRKHGFLIDYSFSKPNSALSESVRMLRTSLFLANIDQPPKVVMITSTLPSEGKSTTSILLASASAQMGKSTVVVDCDLRRPVLATAFGLGPSENDLITWLRDECELEDVLERHEKTGVFVIPVRKSSLQAADILSSKKFASLITTLRERFDFVVLDAPPSLLVTDACVIGKYADCTVYNVAWNATRREAAAQGIRLLRSHGTRVAGSVLTFVQRDRASRYASTAESAFAYYGSDEYYKN